MVREETRIATIKIDVDSVDSPEVGAKNKAILALFFVDNSVDTPNRLPYTYVRSHFDN